jgi:signal peptidase
LHRIHQRTGPLWWIRRIVAWVAILGVATIVALAVALPRLGGATPYAILTGSMEPTLPPGTLAVVRPIPVEDIRIGTVITYQLASGERPTVTHRVVGVGIDGRGERTFRTQGDANNVADAAPVRPVQIRGAVWYAVPALGYANRFLTAPQRDLLIVVVASLLLVYAAWALVSGLRSARRRRAESVAPRHLVAAAERPHRARPVRVGLGVALLALLGAVSTLAYWSDAGTVSAGTFSAGVLDLKLNSQNAVDLSATFTLANMVPGESIAAHVAVQNPSPSTVAFTYTAAGLASGSLGANLQFQAFLGGTSSNGTVNSLRTGSCTGTSTGAAASWASSTTVIPASPAQQLAVGASQNVCVVASLPTSAPSNAQGTSGSAVLTFTATQLGAP